jgi:hypothetical protein
LGLKQSLFKATAVKPPVELTLILINTMFVMQAGHIVGFGSVHHYDE